MKGPASALVAIFTALICMRAAAALEYMLPLDSSDNIEIEAISNPTELHRIKRLASEGEVNSLFRLSTHYWSISKGRTQPEKTEQLDLALAYAYRAALKGHSKSQFLISSCYANPTCKINYEQAFVWLQRSAEGGFVPAMNNLSVMYGRGSVREGVAESEVVTKDLPKSLYWRERAAEAGDLRSLNVLALNYYAGDEYTGKDREKAFYYANKAAQRGSAVAELILGRIYLSGEAGQKVDHAEAARGISASAEKGHRRAMFDMGTLYRSGEAGITIDLKLSHQWYRRAAEMPEDLSDGGIHHGTSYDINTRGYAAIWTSLDFVFGKGVEKNCGTAVRWAQLAETRMTKEVVRELPVLQGYLKLAGCIGPADPGAARALFIRARALGATLQMPSEYLK